jgi:hypothetical protein
VLKGPHKLTVCCSIIFLCLGCTACGNGQTQATRTLHHPVPSSSKKVTNKPLNHTSPTTPVTTVTPPPAPTSTTTSTTVPVSTPNVAAESYFAAARADWIDSESAASYQQDSYYQQAETNLRQADVNTPAYNTAIDALANLVSLPDSGNTVTQQQEGAADFADLNSFFDVSS